MKLEVEGVGEFVASDGEAASLKHYSAMLPRYSSKELLQLLYVARCIAFSVWSQGRRGLSHVRAADILAAAPMMAASVFGEDGRRWLRALHLGSSLELGQVVFKLAADGVISLREQDQLDDFGITSDLDEYMKEPNQPPDPTSGLRPAAGHL